MTKYTLKRRWQDIYVTNEPWIKTCYSLYESMKFDSAKEANDYRVKVLKDAKFYSISDWVIVEIYY